MLPELSKSFGQNVMFQFLIFNFMLITTLEVVNQSLISIFTLNLDLKQDARPYFYGRILVFQTLLSCPYIDLFLPEIFV